MKNHKKELCTDLAKQSFLIMYALSNPACQNKSANSQSTKVCSNESSGQNAQRNEMILSMVSQNLHRTNPKAIPIISGGVTTV